MKSKRPISMLPVWEDKGCLALNFLCLLVLPVLLTGFTYFRVQSVMLEITLIVLLKAK